jgi:chemotaxis protein MotA
MDFMTIFGLLAGAATVYYVMSTGNILHMLLNPAAAVLVFGGTFSAIMIAYPWDILRHAIPACRMIFVSPKNTNTHREGLIDLITSLAEKARRLNLESLQEELHSLDDKFLVRGLQMAVDGIEEKTLKGTSCIRADTNRKFALFSEQWRRCLLYSAS